MSWRSSQAASRERYCNKYDASEVDTYDSSVGKLAREDEDAYLSDLEAVFSFRTGMQVLDVGAGTGTLSKMLARIEGLAITALEPAPAMLAKLEGKPEFSRVRAVSGFCDSVADRGHFNENEFDVIASRQLGNGLFDPLVAFENWRHWLAPGGSVVLIDGLYGRSAWPGIWEEEVDNLPISACQTTALVPYLLEKAGFRIEVVAQMHETNKRPTTMTERYVVVAATAA
jgi:SAM-dependent methyltransferase